MATRNETVMAIEERISTLLETMKMTKDFLTDDFLPDPRHSRAYAEWRILRSASISLQEIHHEEASYDR
jgi:hypothetical protein